MKDTIVILAGGGPAPGINTVISTVAKTFLKDGYRVLGLHDGYKNLFKKEKSMAAGKTQVVKMSSSTCPGKNFVKNNKNKNQKTLLSKKLFLPSIV